MDSECAGNGLPGLFVLGIEWRVLVGVFLFPVFTGVNVNREARSVKLASVWVLGTPSSGFRSALFRLLAVPTHHGHCSPLGIGEDSITLPAPKNSYECCLLSR